LFIINDYVSQIINSYDNIIKNTTRLKDEIGLLKKIIVYEEDNSNNTNEKVVNVPTSSSSSSSSSSNNNNDQNVDNDLLDCFTTDNSKSNNNTINPTPSTSNISNSNAITSVKTPVIVPLLQPPPTRGPSAISNQVSSDGTIEKKRPSITPLAPPPLPIPSNTQQQQQVNNDFDPFATIDDNSNFGQIIQPQRRSSKTLLPPPPVVSPVKSFSGNSNGRYNLFIFYIL
jgi:hypothetical protein